MLKTLLGSCACLALAGLVLAPVGADGQETKTNQEKTGQEKRTGDKDAGRFDGQKFIEKHDKDKDGKLSRDELPEGMRKGFDRIDTDKDGKLSADELRRHSARMMRDGPVEVVTIWVIESQTDFVTRDELQQAYDALRKLDADNDGKITEKEIKDGQKEMMKRRIDAVLKRYDTDNDGKISTEEAQAGALGRALKRLDRNNDGSIDRSELEQAGMPRTKGEKDRGEREGAEKKQPGDR